MTAGTDPLRVLIADDHVPTRAGVRMVLEHEGFEVCAEAANAEAAVEAAVREHPDVCLLDIHMPGSGITAAAEISAALPDTTVVMLTVSSEQQDVSASIQAGAHGYLLKDMDPGRMPDALREVLRGDGGDPSPRPDGAG
jgi:two-component system nitrate/nitrite response regulator NarL